MKPSNVPNGIYPATQSGWVVSFQIEQRVVTFKAQTPTDSEKHCHVKVENNIFSIIYF